MIELPATMGIGAMMGLQVMRTVADLAPVTGAVFNS